MELKHLLWMTICCAWAVGFEGAAFAQEMPDGDNDEVPDHMDLCPGTPGVSTNLGCPEGEEVVIVYGTRDSYSSVVCPNGATMSSYTGCPFFGNLSNGSTFVLAYHNEMSGEYSGNSSTVTVTVEEEGGETDDGDEVDWSDLDDNGNGIPDELEPWLLGTEPGPQPVPQDRAYISRDMCQFDFGVLRGIIPVRVNTCSLCIYGTWGSGGAQNKVSPNCDASAPEPHCLVKHYPEDTIVGRRVGRFECDVVWPPGSEVNK